MALDASSLGSAMAAIIEGAAPPPGVAQTPAQREAMWQGIAGAIIDHFIANGLITGVVTSGAGAGGSVTGTIS